jgi:hypothetical protein
LIFVGEIRDAVPDGQLDVAVKVCCAGYGMVGSVEVGAWGREFGGSRVFGAERVARKIEEGLGRRREERKGGW